MGDSNDRIQDSVSGTDNDLMDLIWSQPNPYETSYMQATPQMHAEDHMPERVGAFLSITQMQTSNESGHPQQVEGVYDAITYQNNNQLQLLFEAEDESMGFGMIDLNSFYAPADSRGFGSNEPTERQGHGFQRTYQEQSYSPSSLNPPPFFAAYTVADPMEHPQQITLETHSGSSINLHSGFLANMEQLGSSLLAQEDGPSADSWSTYNPRNGVERIESLSPETMGALNQLGVASLGSTHPSVEDGGSSVPGSNPATSRTTFNNDIENLDESSHTVCQGAQQPTGPHNHPPVRASPGATFHWCLREGTPVSGNDLQFHDVDSRV